MDFVSQRPRVWALSFLAVLTATAVISATLQGQALETADVRANTTTTGDQASATVARDADGDYVVVWAGNGTQTGEVDNSGVFFQQFDRNGTAQGPESRVNTTTAGDQRNPAVAMDADGNFTVVWEDCGTSGGTLCNVFMQRYDSGGAAQGLETAVNSSTCGDQGRPAIAIAPDGAFIVVWQSFENDQSNPNPLLRCTDTDSYDIFAQQYTAQGLPSGASFQVNTTTAFGQTEPAVAMDVDGDFVVVWQGTVSGAGSEIFARIGTGGAELRVNATPTGNQAAPMVGMSAAGAFVVVWEGPDADSNGVFMRRYNAAGTALAPDEAVNTATTGTQSAPAVAVDASGDFVVAWAGADSEPFGIYFQRYDAAGAAQGSETAANVTTSGDQAYPAVAADADGDFVIAWESDGQDGSGYGLYAGRFAGPEDVNLSVAKTDSTDPVALGGAFSYTVTVSNLAAAFTGSGNATVDTAVRSATGIQVVDTLPGGVVFNNHSGTGWSCDGDNGNPEVVTCDLTDPIEAGLSAAVTLNANAPAGPGQLVNSVTVEGNQYDSVQGNNAATQETYACSGGSGTLAFQSAAFSVREDGDDAGGNDDGLATITVTRSGSTCGEVTVQAATTAGGMPASTATAGQDYTATVTTVTLPNGAASGTFTIAILNNAQNEPSETVNLVLSNPTRATLGGQATAVLTITDDDNVPAVTMSLDNTGTFPESGGTQLVRATLGAVSGQAVTVNLAFAAGAGASSGAANRGTGCGTAQTPADYTCSGTSITIPAGSTTGTVTLTAVGDTRDENDLEPVAITATCSASICTVDGAAPQVTAQIADDDQVPSVQFTAAATTVDEDTTIALPPPQPNAATLTVQLSAASDRTVTVDYAFDPDSPHDPAKATPGSDFTASPVTPSTFTFTPGQTSKTITLTTVVDAVDEADELAIASLSAPTNASLGATASHTVTITDNDTAPTVTFNPATASVNPEADAQITVTAELSEASNLDVTVPFTVSGNASNPADHTAQPGSITIVAGSTTGTYVYNVSDDALDEANETVVLTMGSPTNATPATTSPNPTHTTTITDNDVPPNVTLATTSGNPFPEDGSSPATVTAQLATVSGRTVTVGLSFSGAANRAASCGTVQSPADYACSATSIVIPAGSLSGTMTLSGVDDARDEADTESITVTADCSNGTCIGTGQTTTAEVADNDNPPTLQFTVAVATTDEDTTPPIPPGSPAEPTTVTLTAQLSAVSDRTATVDFTPTGTAARPGDYALSPDVNGGTGIGTLTFAAGTTQQTITLTTVVDTIDEEDETAIVTLSNFVNASAGANTQHTTTISDNDAAPTVSFVAPTAVTADEETGGTQTVQVQLSTSSERVVSVPLSVTGTAQNPADHNAAPSIITIPVGQTTGSYSFDVLDDALDENNETVVLTIGTPTNATAGSSNQSHTTTIDDDTDPKPTVQVDTGNSTATKAEAGGNGSIVVTLSTGSGRAVTVPYTLSGTASSGSDFTISPASPLVFATGETSKTLTVAVINDNVDEPNSETVIVTLGASGQADPGTPGNHTLTITDDDDQPQVSFTSTGASQNEDAATSLVATLQMSRTSTQDVTVPFTVGGSGTDGTDYALLCPDGLGGTQPCAGEVIIAAGTTTANITIDVTPDDRVESNETVILTMGAPVNATAQAPTSYTGTLQDDDTAGVVLVESGTTDVAEGGADDSYTLVLTSEPSADVVISLAHGSDVTTPASVTFTSGNWDQPQTVTVSAVDDAIAEDNDSDSITHSVGSVDLDYDGIAVPGDPVAVSIADNDSPDIVLTESAGSTDVTEGGATDSYTLVLTTQPTADVVITLTPTQVTLSTNTVTFTDADWNVPQTVTVTAVDDDIAEGSPHEGLITHAIASGDANYASESVQDVVPAITDNEVAKVTISKTDVAVTEGGATDTYTIVLDSEPTADVTVNLSVGANADVSTTSVTFNAVNWNLAVEITVSAIDDDVAEVPPQTDTVTHSVTSADAAYNGYAAAPVNVAITDDDVVGFTLTQSGGSTDVAEAGATSDTYTLVLTSEPAADVVITVAGDADVDATPPALTFTSADWNVPQTVTVTAVDDALAETSPHDGTVTHTVDSADAAYDGQAVPDVVANVTDDDVAGIEVTESAGSTDVTEGGATDSYTIVLKTQPTGDVVIDVSSGAQASASTATVTFTAFDWFMPQTVTVTAVDDSVAEGAHGDTVLHVAASSDPDYNGADVAPVAVSITDNDVAGVVVTESAGSTAIAEGGVTDTYTVVLTSEPTADVTITVTGDADAGGSPSPLTFTSGNWNVAQTVTATAVDDAIAEGAHSGMLTHAASSADAGYNGAAIADVAAAIADNDTAGVTVTESGGSTAVTEGGASDSYTIVLTSEPTADVTVTVNGDADVGASPGALIFTSANWSVAQTVNVSAVDDTVDEADPQTGTVTHAAVSNDPTYQGFAVASVTATITDNDTSGVTVTQSGGTTDVAEGGATDTYTIVLTSQPTADVTVTVTGDADVGGSPTPLTFTAANWNVAQTVTATAVNDAQVEGAHSGTLTHAASSGDASYNGVAVASVTAAVTDNDTAGVTIVESSGSTDVTEGGATDTYTVVLTSEPSADVTVTVTGDADVGGSPTPLTFTSANWNVAQTVTATAVNDAIAEGAHSGTLTHSAASADGNYNGIAVASVTAAVTDNDTTGVVVTESGGTTSVTEGGATDTYTIVLTSEPTADVTVTVTGDADIGGGPTPLTFTSADWNVPQTVTATATNDAIAEGNHNGTLTHAATSGDTAYNGIGVASVTAAIADNDTAGVVVTESGGSTAVAEGGATDTYTVVLTSEPTADVTVTVTGDADAGGSPSPLTFTSGNWNVAQTVTVTAVDDAIDEGAHAGTLTHAASSADTAYNGIGVASVTAAIADNDTAGVVVTESGGSTAVAESGATDTYTVVLTSEPTADVTITVTGDADLGGSPTPLTFTSANWNVAQTVTASAVNDVIAEGAHSGTLTHTAMSADAAYNGIGIASVTASITDNDTAGVTVTESGGTTAVTEGGATDTYTIVLSSQPTADVTITVTGDAEVGGSPTPLTFTSANWNVAQTVTATAVDDVSVEGAHSGTLTHAASSADAGYNGATVAGVSVSITDNDVAGVAITQSGGGTAVTEGGTTDTLTVQLTSQPSANVTITPAPGTQLTVTPATLTFTPANFATPQTITVTAVDDAQVEGAHSANLGGTVSSADPAYNGNLSTITVAITDNDSVTAGEEVPGVVVTPSGNATAASEDGGAFSWSALLGLLGLAGLRRRGAGRVLAALLVLAFGPAFGQTVTIGAPPPAEAPVPVETKPRPEPAAAPRPSRLSYSALDLRYLLVKVKDPSVDASGFSLAGSWATGRNLYITAAYSSVETDAFQFLGTTGSSKTDTLGLGLGLHHGLSDRTDMIAAVSVLNASAEGQGGFSGSNDDTGFGLEAGLRGYTSPAFEWNAGVSYVAIFGDNDSALALQGLYRFTPRFALLAGAGIGSNSSQFTLGARYNF